MHRYVLRNANVINIFIIQWSRIQAQLVQMIIVLNNSIRCSLNKTKNHRERGEKKKIKIIKNA